MSAKKVSIVSLGDQSYVLAKKEEGYALYLPQPPDDFGVVAHREFRFEEGSIGKVSEALVQQLGVYVEKCQALESALHKAEG